MKRRQCVTNALMKAKVSLLTVYVCLAYFKQKFYQTDSGDNMPIRFSSGLDERFVSFLMVDFSHYKNRQTPLGFLSQNLTAQLHLQS